MKISTRGRYGTRALVELAVNGEKNPLSLTKIAKNTGISLRYLEQIMRKLKKNNIVKTIQGVKGGYILAKSPDSILLHEIIQTLEGNDYPVECVRDEYKCINKENCSTHKVWVEMHECIDTIMKKYSLKDLM
ncbi:MAG: Rrf2 family transcriptional regulator [Candidatus Muirbacterium halophilum]|nr:Rrf2 family transcriptional regulator [Candidatus Muirbacterium halophilum]MCK9474891.1 Rrf2 family transcriptional regulator [Candidatus Muirbacterium halophilum]